MQIPRRTLTPATIFQIDLLDDEIKLRHKAMICDAVLRYIRA